jgi:Domain of unknown function (DUF1883)
MDFLHYEVDLSGNDSVSVTLDKQANVRLLDSCNYQKYRNGSEHRYFGGLAKRSPIVISAPHSGHWHVVIDLGGYAGSVRASVAVI